MSSLRWAARADANSKPLDDAFRALGCSVEVLKPAARGGIADRLIGLPDASGRRWNILVEYKVKTGKLNIRQLEWKAAWRGECPHVARSIEDVEAIVKGVRSRGL